MLMIWHERNKEKPQSLRRAQIQGAWQDLPGTIPRRLALWVSFAMHFSFLILQSPPSHPFPILYIHTIYKLNINHNKNMQLDPSLMILHDFKNNIKTISRYGSELWMNITMKSLLKSFSICNSWMVVGENNGRHINWAWKNIECYAYTINF